MPARADRQGDVECLLRTARPKQHQLELKPALAATEIEIKAPARGLELFLYSLAMNQIVAAVPLSMDHAGVLRVSGTRVSLDSVIFAFNEGSTPEEIAQQYTTLNLADIYAIISYYLQNQDEVVEYLERRKMQRAEVKEEVESQFDPQGIRDRLLARKRSDVTG
jgi:uncharacterized protein (DUF433 family)